jgi:hypothetical protein
MKKIFKVTGYVLLSLIILLVVLLGGVYATYNEKMPVGVKGDKAEALGQKMMHAVNKTAWDSTHIIAWTSRSGNSYVWDKQRNLVQVSAKDSKVLLNVYKQSGKVWDKQSEVTDVEKASKSVQKAYKAFINDAFWLNPIVKIFDEGTSRSVVTLADGTEGLLVTYSSGGVTPGDSYLWLVDANGIPTAWKLWVGILPIGGLEFSWDNWLTLPTGAKIATGHTVKPASISTPITNVLSAPDLKTLGVAANLFAGIE